MKTYLHFPLVFAFAAPLAAQDTGQNTDRATVAKHMLEAAEEVGHDVERLRGWKFKHPVKKDVRTEAQLRRYIQKKLFDEEYAHGRLQRTEAWLKILALMPEDMDFAKTLMDVLINQVGGFYDPEKQAFFMMVESARFGETMNRMLIAHELCHALDDQYVGLQKLQKGVDGAPLTEDQSFAIGGLVEGSATALMFAWMQEAMQSGEFHIEEMMKMQKAELERSRPLLEAPRYFTLIAANYMVGRHFITKGKSLLGNLAGREPLDTGGAMLQAAKNPPRSTEQLLHPQKYWDEEKRDEPVLLGNGTKLASLVAAATGKDVLQEDTLGELVCGIITLPQDKPLNLALLQQASYWTNKYAKGWGGDRLYLVGEQGAEKSVVKEPGLVWITMWDTVQDRQEFVTGMRRYRGKTPGFSSVEKGRVAVFALGSCRGAELAPILEAALFSKGGRPWQAGRGK